MSKRNLHNFKKTFLSQEKILRNHCIQYDNGNSDFAPEISIKLRLLLSDTTTNHSLVGQIFNQLPLSFSEDVPFISTSLPYSPQEVSKSSIVRTRCVSYPFVLGGKTTRIATTPEPILDKQNQAFWGTFDQWWNKDIILVLDKNNTFTRNNVVTCVCNKLGGAHVDPRIPQKIQNLLDNAYNTFEITVPSTNQKEYKLFPLTESLLNAIVRQIAHEFLITSQLVIKPYFDTKKIPAQPLKNMKDNLRKLT